MKWTLSQKPLNKQSNRNIFSYRPHADWNKQREFPGLPEKDYVAK